MQEYFGARALRDAIPFATALCDRLQEKIPQFLVQAGQASVVPLDGKPGSFNRMCSQAGQCQNKCSTVSSDCWQNWHMLDSASPAACNLARLHVPPPSTRRSRGRSLRASFLLCSRAVVARRSMPASPMPKKSGLLAAAILHSAHRKPSRISWHHQCSDPSQIGRGGRPGRVNCRGSSHFHPSLLTTLQTIPIGPGTLSRPTL